VAHTVTGANQLSKKSVSPGIETMGLRMEDKVSSKLDSAQQSDIQKVHPILTSLLTGKETVQNLSQKVL